MSVTPCLTSVYPKLISRANYNIIDARIIFFLCELQVLALIVIGVAAATIGVIENNDGLVEVRDNAGNRIVTYTILLCHVIYTYIVVS